jgi:tRNA(Ile)-lysidine synthase
LLALIELGEGLGTPFKAVHVNHGLHADAAKWQRHCEQFCRRHDIEIVCLRVRPGAGSGKGIEAEARRLRYAAIAALLRPGDSLLTAHHADDQAETVLLNLMRGSGVDGLSAMPSERPLGAGLLQRPLLDIDKQALRIFLRDRNVGWLEDPSNQFPGQDRNFLRHQVMPMLEQRWPGVAKRLSLTRRAMAETRAMLEDLADEMLGHSLLHPLVLRLENPADAGPGRFKLVVRRWLRLAGVPPLPAHRLETLWQQVRRANGSGKVRVGWEHCALHLYRDQLWLQAGGPVEPCPNRAWPAGGNSVELGGRVGQLAFEGADETRARMDLESFSRRERGELSILLNGHHQRLKNIFQAAAVPPWLRDAVPLTALDGELSAIGDWCIGDRLGAWLGDTRLRLRWRPRDPLLSYVRDRQHVAEATGTAGDELN